MHYSNLRWGTYGENAKDAMQNDRLRKGAEVNTAVLTTAKVRKILKLVTEGVGNTDIAKMFGINKCTVSDIKYGRSWVHVTGIKKSR